MERSINDAHTATRLTQLAETFSETVSCFTQLESSYATVRLLLRGKKVHGTLQGAMDATAERRDALDAALDKLCQAYFAVQDSQGEIL